MRPLPNVIQLTHSLDSVASTAFPWKISKSANVFFRFPTTSGWLLPETTLCFRAYRGKSLFSLVNFSPFQRHHYRSFNGTSCTFPCNLHTLPLFSSFCLFLPHFSFSEWPFPSATNFGSDTFPHLRNCIQKLPPAAHIVQPPCFLCGSSPLVVVLGLHLLHAYTFHFAYRTVSAVFCICCFVLVRIPCFLRVSSRETTNAIFFRGGILL